MEKRLNNSLVYITTVLPNLKMAEFLT